MDRSAAFGGTGLLGRAVPAGRLVLTGCRLAVGLAGILRRVL